MNRAEFLSNRALYDQIAVRQREPGYLRLDVPAALLAAAGALLQARLGALEGVYRVHVFAAAGKVSVRYHVAAVAERDVVAEFKAAIDAAAAGQRDQAPPPREAPAQRVRALLQEVKSRPWAQRLRARLQTLKLRGALYAHQLQAGGGSQLPVLNLPPETRRLAGLFMQDLVTFYLIKTHWTQITTLWLRSPWRHRYEWLTTFYLLYLLVRSRRAAARKP